MEQNNRNLYSFKCYACDETHNNLDTLIMHMNRARTEGVFLCSDCYKDKPHIFILVGKRGSGKSYILDNLTESGFVKPLKTIATREKRIGESDNQYDYIRNDVFDTMLHNNELMEHAFYNGFHYGIEKVTIDMAMSDTANNYLLIVEPNGLQQVKDYFKEKGFKNFYSIFIDVPDHIISNRLSEARQYTNEQIKQSLDYDKKVFKGIVNKTNITLAYSYEFDLHDIIADYIWKEVLN